MSGRGQRAVGPREPGPRAHAKPSVDDYLAYATGALALVPNLPGYKDELAVGAARALLEAVRSALHGGRSIEELEAVLESMVAEPADRFDVDAVVERWLARKLRGDGRVSTDGEAP